MKFFPRYSWSLEEKFHWLGAMTVKSKLKHFIGIFLSLPVGLYWTTCSVFILCLLTGPTQMVKIVNKHQNVSIDTLSVSSMLIKAVFIPKQHCAKVQSHRAASMAVGFKSCWWLTAFSIAVQQHEQKEKYILMYLSPMSPIASIQYRILLDDLVMG